MHPNAGCSRIITTAMKNTTRLATFAVAVLCVLGGAFANQRKARPAVVAPSPLEIALSPVGVGDKGDPEIAALQQKIRESSQPDGLLEQLGWLFVNKARLTSDPGYYKLAEQCSRAIESTVPHSVNAELLRGHVFHALHRFREAEQIARDLVTRREFAFDYALLGDSLMEQGRLDEAVAAYQKMVDLKPCLQTYSRVAHMRWLKGDVAGALSVARLAVGAGSGREPESTAWAYTRAGIYSLQLNDSAAALADCERAMELVPGYPAALLLKGRTLLALNKPAEAVTSLTEAARQTPLPEYLWALAEARDTAEDRVGANELRLKLQASGAASDPRTYALFLATTGYQIPTALELAQAETEQRQDIFTFDALAWAQLKSGRVDEAQLTIAKALLDGTQDARLFLHAGVIAGAAGRAADSLTYLNKADALKQMLLPSERATLDHRGSHSGSAANFLTLVTNKAKTNCSDLK